MNPIILGSSALVRRQLVKEKENFEFKPVKLHLEIDFVSYPARSKGLVKDVIIGCDKLVTNARVY